MHGYENRHDSLVASEVCCCSRAAAAGVDCTSYDCLLLRFYHLCYIYCNYHSTQPELNLYLSKEKLTALFASIVTAAASYLWHVITGVVAASSWIDPAHLSLVVATSRASQGDKTAMEIVLRYF